LYRRIHRPYWSLATGTAPLSRHFGYDRGTPIDRYYIERFLGECAADVKGRVLEIGDDSYSRRFGGNRIERQDILHVHAGNPRATIVGDISEPGLLPPASFDCIVLTQTLHLIFDMAAAVRALHAALKPGGVALVTVPGISPIDRGEWGRSWYWSLTAASAQRLFAPPFGEANIRVDWHGNLFAATAFLRGAACEEVRQAKLDLRDEAYPVTITVRARRA
jgi:SAM-dependent methyltransferase